MTDQTNMSPEQHRTYAADLLAEHAEEFEYLSIAECAAESPHVPGDDISETDARAVHDLIRSAVVTITWPEPAAQPAPRTGPTEEQLQDLRRTHPAPWQAVPDIDFGPTLLDANGTVIQLLGQHTARLVADAVNAHVAGAHHSEATR